MKKLIVLAGLLGVAGVSAQDTQKADEKRPQNPLVAALDANHDGEIDASEINNAPAALRKLDKNGDGKIARAELRANRDGEKVDKAQKAEKKAKKKNNSQ